MPSSVVVEGQLNSQEAQRAGGILHRLDVVVAVLLIVLAFLPYAAVNVGTSTNVPFSSLLCGWLVLRRLHDARIMWTTLLLVGAPFVATALRLLLAPHYLSPATYMTWVFYVLPATGLAAALLVLGRRARPVLSLCIAVSAALAIVQKWYFDQGTIPWLWYYEKVSGYAPVEAIVDPRFNPRVMGLFPEPSVMAGSLVMALMLVVLLVLHDGNGYSAYDALAFALGIPALLLSSSGSVVPTLGILGICALLPVIRRRAWVLVGTPVLMLAAVQASTGILAERTGRFNWSWVDRTSSILIGLERWVQDPVTFLFGIGRGMSTYYFEHGLMPTDSQPHYNPLVDMFTVTGRIPVENGLLVGGLILALLIRPFVSVMCAGATRIAAIGALVTWLIVATVTISYDSAFWIFGLPGGVLGVALLRRDAVAEAAPVTEGDSVEELDDELASIPLPTRTAALRARRRRRRIVTTAVSVVAALAVVVPGVLWRVIMDPHVVSPQHTDAVVVIGPSSTARTDLAERLMHQGYAKALVVSAHPSDTPGVRPSPCGQKRDYPVYCVDPEPATTQGEARMIRRLAAEHGWRSIQVITFTPQVERARRLVSRCYSGDISMIDSREPFEPWSQYAYQSGAFVKVLLTPGC